MDESRARVAPYLLLVWICAIADWALTVDGMSMGINGEANPLMRPIMSMDPLYSLLFKLATITPCVLLLYMLSKYKVSYYGSRVLAGVYIVLITGTAAARVFVL